ncbi:putative Ig domain-containing protein [Thalassotalea sp. PLHSN55]|uniref:putative Ig domain-containing protein n=1 Tax=Thalassotalea sp. PLHSN55 TaxID=3435888 RepID=UPI003F87EFC6
MSINKIEFARRTLLSSVILTALAGCGGDDPEKNLEPTITGSPTEMVYEGQEYSFVPTLFDYEGSSLTVSTTADLPSWLSLNSSTGELSGTPGYADAGLTENIVLTVSDGELETSLKAFNLTVVDVNRPPFVNEEKDYNFFVDDGEVFELFLSDTVENFVQDLDGDEITFSVNQLPSWAHFDETTGAITSYDPQNYDAENITADDVASSDLLFETTAIKMYVSDGKSSKVLITNINIATRKSVTVNGSLVTDAPFAGVEVYFDLNNNLRHDYQEPAGITDANGEFSFVVQGKDAMTAPRAIFRADFDQGSIEWPNSATFEQANVTLLSLPFLDTTIEDGSFTAKALITPYTNYIANENAAYLRSFYLGAMDQDALVESNNEVLDEYLTSIDEIYAFERKGSQDLSKVRAALLANFLDQETTEISDTEAELLLNEARYLISQLQMETDTRDTNGDGIKNFEDDDMDGDGVKNDDDELPLDPTDHEDFDRDNIGNATDEDDDNDGTPDTEDAYPLNPKRTVLDTDGDGYADDDEIDNGTDPLDAESVPADLDGDWISDLNDDDIDGDGTLNADDAFPRDPTEWQDSDNDGIGNNADLDDDNDGVLDEDDPYPFNGETYAKFMLNTKALPEAYTACFADYSGESDVDLSEEQANPVLSCIDINGELTQAVTYNYISETDIPFEHDAQIGYDFFGGSECVLQNDAIRCYSGDLYANGGQDDWATREPVVSQPKLIDVAQFRLCFADLGGVKCLGNDEITSNYLSETNMTNAKYLGSGPQHTCALAGSEVRCDGLDTPYNLDEVPNSISFNNPIDMFTNANFTCVLDEDGLQCWGSEYAFAHCKDIDGSGNVYSMQCMGDSSFFDDDGYIIEHGDERPIKTIAMEDVTAIDMNYETGCLANTENGLTCFGKGFDVPLENLTEEAPEPVLYTMPTLTNVTDIVVNRFDICALADEGLVCFGNNSTNSSTLGLGKVFNLSRNDSMLCAHAENGTYCMSDTYQGFIEDLLPEEE